jgi:hypothetical protein
MRRWLLILLIAVLPLQFSWAAAASYCEHEEVQAGMAHFGHHQHQHHEAGCGDSAHGADHGHDQAAKKSPLDIDSDCSFCHLGGTAVPVAALDTPPAVAPPWVAVNPKLPGSHIPPGLERPDRRIA